MPYKTIGHGGRRPGGTGVNGRPRHGPPAGLENPTPVPAPCGVGSGIENCCAFKSRLQEYTHRAKLPTPEYHTLKEGPLHGPIFKSTVVINGTKYESLPGFSTRKAAEQSAAEAALMEIVQSMPTNRRRPEVLRQEACLCKNLLKEYAEKLNYAIPSYTWTRQASGMTAFTCTVGMGGLEFISAASGTKKEAEIKAAQTALLAIRGQSIGCANAATKYIVVPGERHVKREKKSIETATPLKAKKGCFKKKWNKRKFMKNNGQAVDIEKDEARVDGEFTSVMSPCSQRPAQEPSSDIVVLQPDEEARKAKKEPPSVTATLQFDEEASRVELKPPGIFATPRPGEEARRVEHEPPGATATLQPDQEASRVEDEPPGVTTALKPGKEASTIEHELSSDIVMLQPDKEARRV